jgi:hypothetical protein
VFDPAARGSVAFVEFAQEMVDRINKPQTASAKA